VTKELNGNKRITYNSGMGVGGVPMTLLPSVGCSSRCAKALVEIGNTDEG